LYVKIINQSQDGVRKEEAVKKLNEEAKIGQTKKNKKDMEHLAD